MRAFLILWLASLAIIGGSALLFQQPGYMDAYYYYHVAQNLAQGKGLVENLIWNYLEPPESIPHPSNLYWMPLTSLLIFPFLKAFGESFRAAQLPMVLVASLLPPLAYWIGLEVLGQQRHAFGMAFLTLFSGYYFVYWSALDNFGLFALLVGLALLLMVRLMRLLRDETQARKGGQGLLLAALCGALIALTNLSRADGLLLLPVLALSLWNGKRSNPSALWLGFQLFLVALAAYVLTLLPWVLRSLALGTPLPVGGAKTLFLRHYNDIFSYDAELSLASYLDWGLGPILSSKLEALGRNLLVLFGLEYFLVPFAALGLWGLRKRIEYRPFLFYALLLYLVMSLLFTFPSGRGSMLHSGAALLPWLAGAALWGLDMAVAWVGGHRNWRVPLAQRNLTIIFLLFALLESLILFGQSLRGCDQRFQQYQQIAAWFATEAPGALIMIIDPPGYYYTSGQPSIVVPSNGMEALLAAARRYGASYLVLERVHSKPFEELYRGEVGPAQLKMVTNLGDSQIYRILR